MLKKSNWVLVGSLGIAVVAFLAQMLISNVLAVKSQEMSDLYNRQVVLSKDVSKLELEKSRLTAMSYVEKKAIEAGFVSLKSSVLAIKPAPVASISSF